MSTHLAPAVVAIMIGSVLLVLAFVPFVAISYRRRGGTSFWRSVGWAASVISLLAVFAYTLYPFPDPDEIACRLPIFDPMASIHDVLDEVARGVPFVQNAAVQQLVLNVALFMPIGFLLRAMFRRGIVVAALVGFGLSLLVEFTQKTGIWGIYPCAYRFFDAGDLITNTTGAILGSALAAVVLARRRVALPVASTPRPVTIGRRLLVMVVDVMSCLLLTLLISVSVILIDVFLLEMPMEAVPSAAIGLTAALVPYGLQAVLVLSTGSTFGERVVLLRGVIGRVPAVIARPIRLLVGIGGFGLLLAFEHYGFAALLAIANVLPVFFTRSRQSLAQVLSGMTAVDMRQQAPVEPDAVAYASTGSE